MARKATGSVYFSKGSWFVSLSLEKRTAFRLTTCKTKEEANVRRAVMADFVQRLKLAGKLGIADSICRRAAKGDDLTLAKIAQLVDGLVQGTEHVAPVPKIDPKPSSSMTFRELGELWTSNTLATTPKYRTRVKLIGHADNIRRLEKYVYNVEYEGRKIGDTPLVEFTEDHGDAVLADPSIPEGSLRHVAQCVHKILALAVRPTKVIKQSPLPVGWLPPVNDEKQRAYLFPHEEALLMACTAVALVRRVFMGYCT